MNNKDFANEIRKLTLKLIFKSKSSHIGGAFSMVELIAVLYNTILVYEPKCPMSPRRDRFFLSKGHTCSSLYAALALKGFFCKETLLEEYARDGSKFTSHASHKVPGIELSTGSLGHALSVAVGCSIASRVKSESWKTFVVLGDGELNEGSNWEAIMFAGHQKLSRLTALVDVNRIQSLGNTEDIINLKDLRQKFIEFGWDAIEVDGHDVIQIEKALLLKRSDKPFVIIANTVKGKGVSFMENKLLWHYKSPSEEEYSLAMKELL